MVSGCEQPQGGGLLPGLLGCRALARCAMLAGRGGGRGQECEKGKDSI